MGEPSVVVVVVARQPAVSLIILELVQRVLLRPWAGLLPRHTLEPALRFLVRTSTLRISKALIGLPFPRNPVNFPLLTDLAVLCSRSNDQSGHQTYVSSCSTCMYQSLVLFSFNEFLLTRLHDIGTLFLHLVHPLFVLGMNISSTRNVNNLVRSRLFLCMQTNRLGYDSFGTPSNAGPSASSIMPIFSMQTLLMYHNPVSRELRT